MHKYVSVWEHPLTSDTLEPTPAFHPAAWAQQVLPSLAGLPIFHFTQSAPTHP